MPEPVLTAHLFQPINDALVDLLRDLAPGEWNAPTVAGAWSVHDVAAHLLDTTLRRLSIHRDGYSAPLPADAFANGLSAFVNTMNASGVACLRRLSPRILIELHEIYGRQLAEFFATLDPYAEALWGVTWAGEERSQNWFDVARELTERWHHQQQIRDATARPPLYEHLGIVLETFIRALPYAYRDIAAAPGTTITVQIDDAAWSLVREEQWRLYTGEAPSATTRVSLTGDRAWRIFTRQKIDPKATTEGDARLAEPVLKMVSVL